MALIICPECGRTNVSDSAENCPDCGFGIKSYFDKIKDDEERKRKEDAENVKKVEIQKRNTERLLREKNEAIKRVQNEEIPPEPRFFEQFGGISVTCIIGLFLFGLYGTSQVLRGKAEQGASFYVIMTYFFMLCIIIYKIKQYFDKRSKHINFVINFDVYKQNKIRELNQKYINQQNSFTETKPLPKVQVSSINTNAVKCPRCGSANIQIVKRGWKVTTGFLGSSKNERVCINCMKKF